MASFESVYPAVCPRLRFRVLPRSVEDVAVDLRNLVERADPIGHDPVRVIARRRSDWREHVAEGGPPSGSPRRGPPCPLRAPAQRSVAGEGKLAAGGAGGALRNHPADRVAAANPLRPVALSTIAQIKRNFASRRDQKFELTS